MRDLTNKTKCKFLIFIFFISFYGNAQTVTYNHIYESVETNEIKELFENYLKSNPQNLDGKQFWNEQDVDNYERFDFLEDEFKPSLYMGFPVHVLSIKSNDRVYEIKAQYGMCQESGIPYVLAIVNYYAKKINGQWKLYNALTINRDKWECTNVGYVNYYHPKEYSFNYAKAGLMNEFIKDTSTNFGVKPFNFDYYFADDYDDVKKLQGFDYWIGMGGEVKPSGKASEGKIYCGGMGENFKHEVFHVLTLPQYKNQYYWVTEGVAVFVSKQSRGQSLEWHYKKIAKALENNEEINLNNLVEYSFFDEYTDYHYALGGFIAKKVYEKGGWDLINELMKVGPNPEDYYNAIEALLGINKNELNNYLRKELKQYS